MENPNAHHADMTLKQWRQLEKQAIDLLGLTGTLRFDRGIQLVLFREDVYDCRPSELIDKHKFATSYVDEVIDLDLTTAIAQWISDKEDIPEAKIDLGILATDYHKRDDKSHSLDQFLDASLHQMVRDSDEKIQPRDVVLYGFGRIGRLLARRIINLTGRGDQLRLKAIVIRPKMSDVRAELEKRAELLREDSIHGTFGGVIDIDEEQSTLIVNGNKIKFIFAASPDIIDYTQFGIERALLIDNTGIWRDKEALSIHLRPGIEKVMLTAPGGAIPNIVYGVNESESLETNIISAASCTTNAIVPVLAVLDEEFGISEGHIETIHAYTSDQNLLDNFHKKPRRGKAAALNMVLTSTGAAKAVAKVLPKLAGKLTGNAVRVPTPDVSLAVINLSLNKKVDADQINASLKQASLKGALVEQLHYSSSTELVSNNVIGTTSTSIVDAPSTLVSHDGNRATIYVWYDNEYGYCCQVVRLAKYFAQVRRATYL